MHGVHVNREAFQQQRCSGLGRDELSMKGIFRAISQVSSVALSSFAGE
jgi:hypothetical protein